MRALALSTAVVAAAVLAVAARADVGGPPWGPETPNFNLEVILRAPDGGDGFGHVKFRQPNDADEIINLDVWVRDLAPNTRYRLRRAVDTVLDGTCSSKSWVPLGRGLAPQAITTDDRGTGREHLYRNVSPVAPGTQFDIHFQVIDVATSTVVLESGCYSYTVSR
jgi:hypothetical protein